MFGIEYLSKFDNCLSKTIQNFPKLSKTTADHTFYFISENLVRFHKNQMLSVQPFKTDRYISLNVNKQIISDSNFLGMANLFCCCYFFEIFSFQQTKTIVLSYKLMLSENKSLIINSLFQRSNLCGRDRKAGTNK